jgi:hypothetical protein
MSSHSHTAAYALAPQVLHEFIHVATDPRRFAMNFACAASGRLLVYALP